MIFVVWSEYNGKILLCFYVQFGVASCICVENNFVLNFTIVNRDEMSLLDCFESAFERTNRNDRSRRPQLSPQIHRVLHEMNSTDRYMIDHVFLHRSVEGNLTVDEQVKAESFLLKELTSTLEEATNLVPLRVQRLFNNMMQLCRTDKLDPNIISNQISDLAVEDMFGMYIREQNCGLLIRKTSDTEATLSTFQVSLPNEVIYDKTVCGDIQVNK